MDGISSRRNGKPASCEPCRQNKTKCDHTFPKCNRCRQRGIEQQCFYHPAPLTKRRAVGEEEGGETSSTPRPPKRKNFRVQTADRQEPVPTTHFPDQHDKFTEAVASEARRPGFLGPTSYAALLPKDDLPSSLQDRAESVASDVTDQDVCYQHPLSETMHVQLATDILKTLRYHSALLQLVISYSHISQDILVPAPIEIEMARSLKAIADKHNLATTNPSPRFVSRVLQNTSQALHIPPSTTARGFHKLCSGDNLRLETMGFILSLAVRVILFGCVPEMPGETPDRNSKRKLLDELLRASTSCILLCTLISPTNDLMCWMFLENYRLMTMVCGFSGPPSWRRLNELASYIYALGLHRESSYANLPTWLSETRRRVYAAAYQRDKSISTFLGRPVRMSKRYSDVKMPSDLSDDEVVSDQASLELAINALDAEGWNTQGQYTSVSYSRLSFICSKYQEDILDLALAKVDSVIENQLLSISRRMHDEWNAVPSHLRYWPTCWDEVPHNICLELVFLYLHHLYNEFMIQKLISTVPPSQNAALLRVSMELLSSVLTIGTSRDRSYDVKRDFLMGLVLKGIPSASVVVIALQEQHRSGQPFPPGISRAEMIRNISVLISYLDAAPSEACFTLCRRASKCFTRVVDSILDPKPVTESTQSTAFDADLDFGLEMDMFTGPGFSGMDGPDFTAWNGEDANGIDWGTTAAQWVI